MLQAAGKLIRDAFSGALDLIYPPHCVVCKSEGESYLCAKCIEQIDLIEPPYCHICGMPLEPGQTRCDQCRQRIFAFESACCAAVFDGALRQAIHAFKFRGHIVMAGPLADIMSRHFPRTHLAGKVDLLVPIPIHGSRMLERGFNQSLELACRFGKAMSLPVESQVLIKKRDTLHQVNLPYHKRGENMREAFGVQNTRRIAGKRLLLIDDVFTTGSTLQEAASVLRKSGAAAVHVYTLSRSL